MIRSGQKPRSKLSTNLRLMIAMVLCAIAALTLVLLVIAHPQTGRREIVSDDFTKPRPSPTPKRTKTFDTIIALPKPRPTPMPPKHYRLATSSSPDAAPLTATDNVEQLGVTLWRLRPAKVTEPGQRLLIRETNRSLEWAPKRIEMDTPLPAGDRVRLSIESPREGYLYVIDRDLYADGNLGDAMLLFPTPTTRGVNNKVGPGKLIDLPGQKDNPNFFIARLRRSTQGADQVGKVLTIIVTNAPLDLKTSNQPLLIPAANIAKWEKAWGSTTERFEMIGGAGQAWTSEEKEAASATGSGQLTRDDPPPQTIYRIAATNKAAFLVNARLSYSR